MTNHPLIACVRELTRALGADFRAPPDEPGGSEEAQLTTLLDHSALRSRRVLLRGLWWRQNQGPLLCWREADGQPCALVPGRWGGYRLFDPHTGTYRKLSGEEAEELRAEALMLYPTLQAHPYDWRQTARFSVFGLARELNTLVGYGIMAALLGVLVPVASGLLVDQVIPRGDTGGLLWLLLGILGAVVGMVCFEVIQNQVRLRLEARADLRLQNALFDRVLRLPMRFVKAYEAGDLVDRMLGMQRAREALSGAVMSALLSMVFSLVSLLVLFFYSVPLAGLAMVLVAVYAGVVVSLVIVQLRHERRHAHRRGVVQSFNTQLIIGMQKLQMANATERAFAIWAERFAAQKREFMAAGRAANRLAVFQALFQPLATGLLILALAWLAGLLSGPGAATDELMSAGMFVAFTAAFGQFLQAANGGISALSDALNALPSLERARPILQQVPEEHSGRAAPPALRGAIRFDEVCFGYQARGPAVLERLSFHVPAGRFTAIVGPSGSGKSTLLKLMMALAEPDQGEVWFDDRPVSELDLVQLRRQLGVVLQDGVLPGGTLHEIILGEAGGGIDQAWRLAEATGLKAEIEAMPMGMHTVIQEGGATLSGGQKQRLAIARALARRPAILLLDEATSALDNLSQAQIVQTLASLNVTRVAIAHRLSTVRNADQILVLKQGRIVESGSYTQLMQGDTRFRQLAERQLV